jgi:transposase-like protein
MVKKEKERRVYPEEFKAEAVALARKHEKPVCQIAVDLGISENMLYRWIQQAREAGGGVKLRFIRNPKKSGRTVVRVIFAQEGPR